MPTLHVPPSFRAGADLEAYLQDAWSAGGRFAIPDAVTADERGEMYWPAVAAVREWGLPSFLVPESLGGRLRTVDELLTIFRVLARRDMRVVVGYGSTFLGALPVWLWGDPAKRALVANRILNGDFGSCAISEREHGSDLAGNECAAERRGGQFWLTGEKWPIGNASRGTYITVLAKTGFTGSSLLLVDKAGLDPARWHSLPMAPTVGLRGHDLSGVVFDGCPVPVTALLGREGAGVAQTLRTLHVTRTLIAGLSLGTLDTALRIMLGYADRRRLYGASIVDLPVVRDILLTAYLDALVGECVALSAARGVSAAPARMSLWSAVTKYLVPVLVEEAVAKLATVLSARQYIQEGTEALAFQKLQRDHAIVSIFDGTTHVNLSGIASQLPAVLVATRAAAGADRSARDEVLRALFSRTDPAPGWEPYGNAPHLTSDGEDEIVAGWDTAVRDIAALADADGAPVYRDLIRLLADWDVIRAAYQAEVLELARTHRDRQLPVRAYTLARTHSLFHAAAACVHTWLVNRERATEPLATGAWLVLCLERLLQRLDSRRELSEQYRNQVEKHMRLQFDEGWLFSLTPLSLGT